MKRLYLIKKEVKANNIREAIYASGRVISVEETKDEPLKEDKDKLGFKK